MKPCIIATIVLTLAIIMMSIFKPAFLTEGFSNCSSCGMEGFEVSKSHEDTTPELLHAMPEDQSKYADYAQTAKDEVEPLPVVENFEQQTLVAPFQGQGGFASLDGGDEQNDVHARV